MPRNLILWIGAALLVLFYLRSPIDLIPDWFGLIGMVDDLAVLIATILWIRRQMGEAPPPASESPKRPARWDPYAVLGVARGATREQITHAYRDQMKRYHPDRVADLGEELKQLAHQKAVDIQRAYDELTG